MQEKQTFCLSLCIFFFWMVVTRNNLLHSSRRPILLMLDDFHEFPNIRIRIVTAGYTVHCILLYQPSAIFVHGEG